MYETEESRSKENAVRSDNRQPDELRPVDITLGYTGSAPGSVLIKAGRTTVLCTASIDDSLPPWKKNDEIPSGWVTAEYSMLPGSTSPRNRRSIGKIDGRSSEIQRLIGRSLRSVVDFEALGPRTITIDCDVLEADGGTRTASITGGYIALAAALKTLDDFPTDRPVLKANVAAISVGMVESNVLLDLCYVEDSAAEVDMNVVMTSTGEFVEVQGTAEGRTFGRDVLNKQLDFAEKGIRELVALQNKVLGVE
ncbi:MAG: ribonuclease PH [Planctomycetaceae bacterium]|jgi:ribonuclease PH